MQAVCPLSRAVSRGCCVLRRLVLPAVGSELAYSYVRFLLFRPGGALGAGSVCPPSAAVCPPSVAVCTECVCVPGAGLCPRGRRACQGLCPWGRHRFYRGDHRVGAIPRGGL